MNQRNHGHHQDHHSQGHHHEGHQGRQNKGLHKDWRAWVAVGLMLAAMAFYLLTMDESIVPGAGPGERMPAADAPPAAP